MSTDAASGCRIVPQSQSNRSLCLLYRRGQQGVLWGFEWINQRYSPPSEAVLEILAQQEAAFLVGRHRKDQCVPDRHLVIGGQVECPSSSNRPYCSN